MKGIVSVCICVLVAAAFVPALAADAPDGKALYGSKCAMCHGPDGVAKATAKGSASFNDPAFAASVDDIVKVTMEGKNKMPKYEGKLTADEVRAIAAHIKTMAPKK
jgi:mono/diheme cytochrome c family protein